MEKLINLLNEYEAKRHKTSIVAEIRWQNGDRLTYLGLNNHYSELLCISKGYLFIDWLCHNNKIDFDKVMKLWIPCFVQYDKWEIVSVHDVDFDRQLIMLLSISDTPIEDLISYLR